MKEFSTAIRDAVESPEAPMEFKIDGQVIRAYRPTDGQIAMLMAALGRHTSESTKIAGVVDFFVATLDDDGYNYVTNRLLSREDALEMDQIQEVIEWMIEEWSGRPTQQPSASTPLQASGGPKSSPTTSRSTSSVLVPADS